MFALMFKDMVVDRRCGKDPTTTRPPPSSCTRVENSEASPPPPPPPPRGRGEKTTMVTARAKTSGSRGTRPATVIGALPLGPPTPRPAVPLYEVFCLPDDRLRRHNTSRPRCRIGPKGGKIGSQVVVGRQWRQWRTGEGGGFRGRWLWE